MRPDGGVYSAEDADSYDPAEMEMEQKEKKEGAFYAWTCSEIDSLLTHDEALAIKEVYGMKEEGNCTRSRYSDPHHEFAGKNVFYRKHGRDVQAVWSALKESVESIESVEELEGVIASGRRKLFGARCERPRPHLDSKVICGWNGLILSSFAVAHKVLVLGSTDGGNGDVDGGLYLETAVGIAEFMHREMRDAESGYLYRIHGKDDIFGFAADYSFLIRGLLDLFEASFDAKWLKWSVELQDIQNALFFDDAAGSYFETVEGAENVIMRLKEEYDGGMY